MKYTHLQQIFKAYGIKYTTPKRNKETARGLYLNQKYGLTIEKYEEMRQHQNNKCAICDQIEIDLFVDHDHDTGKIRGLLCHNCNVGLGWFKDDIISMLNAVEYILKNGQNVVALTKKHFSVIL